MTLTEKTEKCREFFDKVSVLLKDNYEVVASCNADLSAYLVPNGTKNQITYHSKPKFSFRISDHWNWYSNLRKCPEENYVQCESVDMPRAKTRISYGKASNPIRGAQVGFFGEDGKYHCVYGEFYNRETHSWNWKEVEPEEIANMVMC